MSYNPGGRIRTLVLLALQRGLDAGHTGCAIYLPGEDVRCIHPDPVRGGPCCGYLYTEGPESTAHVRTYEERRFHERRRTPRGNFRCSKHERHRLEIESHIVTSMPTPSSSPAA